MKVKEEKAAYITEPLNPKPKEAVAETWDKVAEAAHIEKRDIFGANPEYSEKINPAASQGAYLSITRNPNNVLKFYRSGSARFEALQQKLQIPLKVYFPDGKKFKEPKSIVIGVHGVCMHSKSLMHLADELTSKGHIVVCPDLAGQGKNNQYYDPGIKNPIGHVDSYEEWTSDVNKLYKALEQEFPGQKIDLFGHSMGGLVVATAAQKYNIGNNIILSVPGFSATGGIRPLERIPLLPEKLKQLYLPGLEGLFGVGEPGGYSWQFIFESAGAIVKDAFLSKIPLQDYKTYVNMPKPLQKEELIRYNKNIENNPRLAKEYRPLRELTEVTSKFLLELAKLSFAAKRAVKEMPENRKILFILAAEDKVVDWKTIADMYNKCKSKNKSLLVLEKSVHDYIWYNQEIDHVVNWLSRHYEENASPEPAISYSTENN